MFKNIYPLFEEKRLLTKEMLENLRDYPRSITDQIFSDFANGILSGCNIMWDQEVLTVGPGMVCWKGMLYVMEEAASVACGPRDSVRYLKIQFMENSQEPGKVIGRGKIVLEEKEVDLESEMELGRFRLQKGARLRCKHENFEDYSTRFDTVDQIDTPYGAKEKSTMKPEMLMQYAKELLKTGTSNPLDLIFAMNLLNQNGQVSMEGILAYIEGWIGGEDGEKVYKANTDKKISRQRTVYESLLKILKEQRLGTVAQEGEAGRRNRKILLL